MSENAKICPFLEMLLEKDPYMTNAFKDKSYNSIVTQDDEGVMPRWNFSFGL